MGPITNSTPTSVGIHFHDGVLQGIDGKLIDKAILN